MKEFQNPEHQVVSRWSIVDSVLLFIVFILVVGFTVSIVHRWFFQKTVSATIDRSIIKIQVLNGCGDDGAAEQVTQVLREHGFDILFYGNADSFDYQETLVVDHVGKRGFARIVAESLNCQNIRFQEDNTLRLDVTVILGKDWENKLNETNKAGTARFLNNIIDFFYPPM